MGLADIGNVVIFPWLWQFYNLKAWGMADEVYKETSLSSSTSSTSSSTASVSPEEIDADVMDERSPETWNDEEKKKLGKLYFQEIRAREIESNNSRSRGLAGAEAAWQDIPHPNHNLHLLSLTLTFLSR